MKKTTIDSQPSWILRNSKIDLAVTELGGHMAPVTFAGAIQPYYISPWQNEKAVDMPAVMLPLRGDFFCLPFGGNSEKWKGEKHPPHGETSGSNWKFESCVENGATKTLELQMQPTVRPGLVRRSFTITEGEDAVYCSTRLEGFSGPMPFAHHAVLRMPSKEGALRIFTSKFDFGRTYPVPLADPSNGEYQSLATNAAFRSLAKVPSIFKGERPVDCSAFPTRPGFCDLLQQFERPNSEGISWVAAVNLEEGWLWFALKNPAVMPGRLFWIENKGRHAAPWSGRNSCLGIEDGCMYFDRGIAVSNRSNPVNQRGVPTCVNLSKRKPLDVRYIQGAIPIPANLETVGQVLCEDRKVVFRAKNGMEASAAVNCSFLKSD